MSRSSPKQNYVGERAAQLKVKGVKTVLLGMGERLKNLAAKT